MSETTTTVKLTTPHNGTETDFPRPIIEKITPTHIIPGQQQKLIFQGQNLNEFTWIEVENCQTDFCEIPLGTNQVEVTLTANDISQENRTKTKYFTVKRGRQESPHQFYDLLSLIDPAIISKVDNKGWLELNNNFSYSIGTSDNDEIRHYSRSRITQNAQGLYISRGQGYISFPILSWNRNISKTVDFIFYLKGDRYFSLGLINELYKPYYSNARQAICAFRFERDQIRYCYGNNLVNFIVGERLIKNNYYRFRIPNNGEKRETVQLFKLASAEKNDWENGELIWEHPVPLNFSETGNILTPTLFEYNGSTNPLLAIRAF